MQLEITNCCNLNCSMCPTHARDSRVTRPQGFITLNNYDKTLEMFKKLGGNFLIPQGAGESSLHPEFIECLDLAKSKYRLKVGLNTNGIRIDRNVIRRILTLGIDEIGFSIDALTGETYRGITGKDELDHVKLNAMELVTARRSAGLAKPLIRVLIVEQEKNRSEIDGFVKFWLDHVDEVIVQTMRVGRGRRLSTSRKEPRKPCRHLFDTVFIQWDGAMPVCCEDWNSESIVGNVFDTPLSDLWYGEKMRKYRKMQRTGRYTPPDICLSCEAWAGGRTSRFRTMSWEITESALTRTYRKGDGR